MDNIRYKKKQYKIAELNLEMKTYFDKTYIQAESYCSYEDTRPEFVIDFSIDYYKDIQKEQLVGVTLEDVEYMCTGSAFNRYLIKYNGCMLHSSAVVIDEYAYLFSAESGTGKSTHTSMWIKHFADRAYVLNDDKPVLRYINGRCYAYGTPWSGKTDVNRNEKVKLGAIVFLERAKQNWITQISDYEAIPNFLSQTVRKLQTKEMMNEVLDTIEKIITDVPIYKMGCTISEEAVIMAYETIRRV